MQDPIFEMPVTFFEGHATFTQRVELLDKDYELKGYLKYGACNDENCLPPTSVNAKVAGTDGPAPTAESMAEEAAAAAAQGNALTTATDSTAATATDSAAAMAQVQPLDSAQTQALWTPVIKELKNFGSDTGDMTGKAWYYIFFLGFVGGLVALFTPCVWPIIPMTVSFFLKRSGDRRKGVRDAITYGVSIVVPMRSTTSPPTRCSTFCSSSCWLCSRPVSLADLRLRCPASGAMLSTTRPKRLPVCSASSSWPLHCRW